MATKGTGKGKGYNKNSKKNLEKGVRFKPGQSGNPAGRPAGTRNFRTVIGALMDSFVDLERLFQRQHKRNFGGTHQWELKHALLDRAKEMGGQITWREAAILIQAFKAVVEGNTFSLSFLADREEGRPTQALKVAPASYVDFLDGLPEPEDESEK